MRTTKSSRLFSRAQQILPGGVDSPVRAFKAVGMDPLFKEVGIYAALGQRYEPVDSDLVLSYREAVDGQVIEEGITEAGSMASFQAAGTSYATHGLATIPFSAGHLDGSVMMVLSEWAQRIVTFRGGAADLIRDVDWVFKVHMFLGLTIFLIFPFSRLVHIWSAPVWYVFRPYQVVRKRGARGPSREVRT